jgi:hypothetical protein
MPTDMMSHFRTQNCTNAATLTLKVTTIWYITMIKYKIFSSSLDRCVKKKDTFRDAKHLCRRYVTIDLLFKTQKGL